MKKETVEQLEAHLVSLKILREQKGEEGEMALIVKVLENHCVALLEIANPPQRNLPPTPSIVTAPTPRNH